MPNRRPVSRWSTTALLTAAALLAVAPWRTLAQEAEPGAKTPKATFVEPTSELAGLKLPPGFKAELFAAEPMVQNPSAFCVDAKGRIYVVEAHRRKNGTLDMRQLKDWVEEDLASRGVNDRIAMVKRHLTGKALDAMTEKSDRIRLLEDRDGDGKADHDTVFADGFNKLENGTAAGVLAWRGNVYFTEIPDLWLLKDTKGTGKADERKSLAWGFGVHYTYSGHDMHGLRMGPDGKVYWSIADRGARIEKDGKVLIDNADSGAVFRCDPDGSNLERFATGLRNPQELAFDNYGNLFTGDNNSDAGDATRWVYVVEGGDSGWRTTYQYHDFPISRGPWMSERPWEVNPTLPAPYRIPPIANPKISGPSGLTHYPGTGMPKGFDDTFLLVDFKGGASNSYIYSLKNKPSGAGFELEEVKEVVGGSLPTDVDFGFTGGFYFTSWVNGWDPLGQGRIYRVYDPAAAKNPVVSETAKLMADGFGKMKPEQLIKLLAHQDQRVRLEAQYSLADVGAFAVPLLTEAAKQNESQLARIHAIWALGQITRHVKADSADAAVKPLEALVPLLDDADDEVRAQAARILGDNRCPLAFDALVKKVKTDKSPRVRYFAAIGLGKFGKPEAMPAVVAMLKKNADKDAFLRHAGVMALAGIHDVPAIAGMAKDESGSLRLAAILALRRLKAPEIGQFLNDADPSNLLEVARAINDEPIDAAMPQLADVLANGLPNIPEPFRTPTLLRMMNANYRTGDAKAASVVAGIANRNDLPDALRAEALHMLAKWDNPPARDRVSSLYRPLPARPAGVAKAPLQRILFGLLQTASDAVKIAALNTAVEAGIQTAPLSAIVADIKGSPGLRAAALAAMGSRKDPKLAESIKLALKDSDAPVRIAAIRLQPKFGEGGVEVLADKLAKGTPREQQAVLQAIGTIGSKDKEYHAADPLLASAMDRLEAGTLPREAQLDLLSTIATTRKTGKLSARQKAYEEGRKKEAKTDALAAYRDCLTGGDTRAGEAIFRDRQDVSCMRCHAVKGVGGNAGPDLAGTSSRAGGGDKGREHILESILYPSKKIAPGFETVSLKTADDTIAGVLKTEDATTITLEVPNQGVVKIEKSKVQARTGGLSAMPDDIAKPLSKHDLRDLVEYLAGQER